MADALTRLPSVFVSTYPAAYCYRSPLFVGICKSTRCVNSRAPDAAYRHNVSVLVLRRTLDHSTNSFANVGINRATYSTFPLSIRQVVE